MDPRWFKKHFRQSKVKFEIRFKQVLNALEAIFSTAWWRQRDVGDSYRILMTELRQKCHRIRHQHPTIAPKANEGAENIIFLVLFITFLPEDLSSFYLA